MKKSDNSALSNVFDKDEVDDVLRNKFYRTRKRKPRVEEPTKQKPTHYEVICISMYTEDLSRLDQMVKELKDNGHRKMSRSGLIRFALDHVDLDELPKAY